MTRPTRTTMQAGALVLAGAVVGGVLAVTVGASASSGGSAGGAAAYSAGPGHGPGSGPGSGPGYDGRAGGRPMMRPLPLAGTVTSVGTSSVTITVNGTAKTYQVTPDSDIDKNGEAKLSDLRAGDAVRFALMRDGATIAVLHAGDEAKDRPAGPPGAPGFGGPGFGFGGMHRHGLPLSGKVTSVGTNSVTITVNGTAKTYQVTPDSDIDKNGEAKLSDLRAGDAVRFALLPDGSTIAVLHAGDEAKDRPAMHDRPGDGPGGPAPSAAPTA